MKITILGSGTSQGVPVVACDCAVCQSDNEKDKRLRASILIETADTTIVVDAGPDFRQQMLREKVKKLDAILITHSHKDHIAGLDDVRSFNYLSRKPMRVYASQRDQEEIKREFSYAFDDHPYPGVPRIEFVDLKEEPFQIGDLKIIPFIVKHRFLDVYGFRIGDFAYITDTNHIPEKAMQVLQGTRILILDALRKEQHISHFTLSEALNIADTLNVEQAYFTHISHLMGFHEEVQGSLNEKRMLAWDGLEINI